jgi:hypothetical protein
MSDKLTMPKNVQAFVNKYGRIGSKEQDATFWKEFRKAANAYADVQAKRISDIEHALTAVTEQRNQFESKLCIALRGHPDSELWGDAGLIAATMRCVDALDELTEQRDRLAEALRELCIALLTDKSPDITDLLNKAGAVMAAVNYSTAKKS